MTRRSFPDHLARGRNNFPGPLSGGMFMLSGQLSAATGDSDRIALSWPMLQEARLLAVMYYSRTGVADADLDIYQNTALALDGNEKALLNGTIALDTGANGMIAATRSADTATDNIGAAEGATLIQNRDVAKGDFVFCVVNADAVDGAATDVSIHLLFYTVGQVHTDPGQGTDFASYRTDGALPGHLGFSRGAFVGPVSGTYLPIMLGNYKDGSANVFTDRVPSGLILPFDYRLLAVNWDTNGLSSVTASFQLYRHTSAFQASGGVALLSAAVTTPDTGEALASGTTPTLAVRNLLYGDRISLAITKDATGSFNDLHVFLLGFAKGLPSDQRHGG